MVTVLTLAASLPWVISGWSSVQCDASGLARWLPDSHEDRVDYERFTELFGNDDSVLVTWSGCTLTDSRLPQFANVLAQLNRSSSSAAIARIVTGPDLLEKMTTGRQSMSSNEARARLQGLLIGPDGNTTCAIVSLTDAALADQRAVIELIRHAATAHCGINPLDLHLGGTAAEAAAIAAESEDTLRNYTVPVTIVTLIVAWLCLRSLRLLVAIGLASAYCRFMTMAVVYYTGTTLSAVLIVAPVLTYVLTMSGAVHLVNYYRDVAGHAGTRQAPWDALRVGWKPCALAAVTTSLGLVSLAVSQTGPIREFGYYSSACLMVSLAVMLSAVPTTLFLWPVVMPPDEAAPQHSRIGSRSVVWLTTKLPSIVIRHYHSVLLVSGVLLVITGIGLAYTRTSVKIEHLFHQKSRIIQDYTWIENQIGPVGTIEFLVRFEDASDRQVLKRFLTVRRIDTLIQQVPGVEVTMSAATFLPSPDSKGGVRTMLWRAAYRRQLLARIDALKEDRLLADDGDGEVWRISVRQSALQAGDAHAMADRIMRTLDQAGISQSAGAVRAQYRFTGLLPLVESAQHVLLMDLVKSVAFALILICPTMMLVLRDVRAGLLAMIPNVAPIVLVFGIMGWLGEVIDAGSMLTASVAMGIAVDDTLHYLKWFRQGSRNGLTRQEAIQDAFRRCAPAMVQTTLICGVGLLLLTNSYFVPTERFAVLLLLLLLAALPGDLVLLPALLASPWGRYFEANAQQPLQATPDAKPSSDEDPSITPEP